jgi:hypothetical protein
MAMKKAVEYVNKFEKYLVSVIAMAFVVAGVH